MDVMKLMQQAGRLQEKISELNNTVQTIEVEGVSGGGSVTIAMRGDFTASSVRIDPEFFKEADAGMVEDLLLAALQDAHMKATQATIAKKEELIGDLGLPSGLKLPF